MNKREKDNFTKIVWDYYHNHARTMPWRLPEADDTFDPYKILVSEFMLQQTQVERVLAKYTEFIRVFPDIEALANAKLEDVLRVWSGLGYNRRARYLHDFSKACKNSIFPDSAEEIARFKGIGINTASAVFVYSYNQPLNFVETNIRTVFFYHFYKDDTGVDDKDILKLVQETIDLKNPREWYWAIMDYGSYLKKNGVKNTAQSKHYKKQSTFAGSERQLRGKILRLLLQKGPISVEIVKIELDDDRVMRVISNLEKDRLVNHSHGVLSLP